MYSIPVTRQLCNTQPLHGEAASLLCCVIRCAASIVASMLHSCSRRQSASDCKRTYKEVVMWFQPKTHAMPPKKKPVATEHGESLQTGAAAKRRMSAGDKQTKRRDVTASDSASSDSDDGSDPDEDIVDHDLMTVDGRHVLDFDCVREASRSRVAERTRSQYDLFIGLMAAFALSNDSFKSLVLVVDGKGTFKPPLPISFVSAYIDFVEAKRVPWPGKVGELKCVSTSYYKTVVLSLKDLYICQQVIMTDEMELFLFSKRKKFSREIQNMRSVGKYPEQQQRFITSEGYTHLAKTVAEATPSSFGGWAVQAFAGIWVYVVLLWNLMARCDRVARLRWADFGWYKDALTAYLCKSKCDQAGINAFHKKLYFNDLKPEVCPVTALAVLFFSRDEESARCEFVFPRSDTRRNGNRYLSKIIASKYSTATDTAIFGCDPLGIAWHHFKRGAFTFLAGLTDGCSYVATKMRADQKVADVSRVYTFFGQGQDGVIGRLLSLLPYGEPEFIGCAPVLAGVHVPLNEVVSDWETLDERFKLSVVPKFVACLVHRQDWLKTVLAADHPLWQSRLVTSGKLVELKAHVQLELRPLAGLTGVSLEMKNAIHLHALSPNHNLPESSVTAVPTAVPNVNRAREQLPPAQRDDLGYRLLRPLPTNKKLVPHLTIRQAWRAWFITSDSLPYPLRFAEGKLTLGCDVTALSRIKTCMTAVSNGIDHREILQHPEATFDWGWNNLQQSLFDFDSGIVIQCYNSCGTLERKLRSAKQRGWKAKAANAFRQGPVPQRPLAVAVAEAQQILAAAAAAAPAGVETNLKPKWKCSHCGSNSLSKVKFRYHHENSCREILRTDACFHARGTDCDKCVIRVVGSDEASLFVQGDLTGKVVSRYVTNA